MRKSQIYSIILLVWLLLLSLATFTPAATPSYVGIENNDTYTWDTTYDEDPLEDYIEDYGEEKDWSDNKIDEEKDEIAMDDDLTQLKIVILDVDEEEKSPWGEDGVRIIYNIYFKEEEEDWDLESEDETWAVWKYDKDFYEDGLFDDPLDPTPLVLGFRWKSEYDEDKGEWETTKYLKYNNPWFISTKTDWKEVEDELEEYYEDDEDYDDVKITREDVTPGLQITLDEDEDDEIEVMKWIIEYDDNGVLMHYEWQYDGEPIVIVQTQESQIREFISENMIWIIIGAIGVVVVIIILVVVIYKRGK